MKYLLLDFGDVLFYPTTGNWFITPKFKELVDMELIDSSLINNALKASSPILSYDAFSLDDEYYLFREYYRKLLKELNYPHVSQEIINELAYNYSYESDKCLMYDGVKEELEELSKKYELILLSDNWPCGERLLKENDIYDFFTRIYISSVYGSVKQQGTLFMYPIRKFGLNKENALFIDDKEALLDVADSKGLNTMLMNRENKDIKSKHKVITNLKNI